MDVRSIIRILSKWWWLIIASAVIAGVSSYIASNVATPLYKTHTTLMIGQITQDPNPNAAEIYTSQQLAETYIQLATRQPVLQGAIDALGLDIPWQSLKNVVSVNVVPRTQLIEIGVVDSDPYRAQVLADTIAEQLILLSPANPSNLDPETIAFTQEQIADLENKIQEAKDQIESLRSELDTANSARQIVDLQNQINILETKISDWQNTYSQLLMSVQGGEVNTLTIVEKAALPTQPFSPDIPQNVLISTALGIALAIAGAFVIEFMDDTIKEPEEVETVTKLPLLGAIERIKGEDYPDKLIALKTPRAPATESFRVLRTNLQFSSVDNPPRKIVVTSPSPSEGKSITTANLAVVLAQSGERVILVDTDLRKPVQHKIFEVDNKFGITDLILDKPNLPANIIKPTKQENLRLLTSGPIPPNSADILGSAKMSRIIQKLGAVSDIVLFDSPPGLLAADASLLGSKTDGVIIVVDAGRTGKRELRKLIDDLRKVRVNILGVVMNRVSEKSGRYYYYYYYYSSNGDKKKRRKTSRRQNQVFEWLGALFNRSEKE